MQALLIPRLAWLVVLLLLGDALVARAEDSAIVSALQLKDLNGHFPMTVPSSREQWESRADELRLQVKIALGVHPMPSLASTAPVIYGKRDMDGYSVEKMFFESLPGFFVTGSLYRPLGTEMPANGYPAVLYAHGHWDNGRFYEAPANEVRQLLATGAERFENAAINHMQAACVQLARMGVVVFQFDMIGYADSQQISFERAHRYGIGLVNPTDESAARLLYSARSEGYGQSIMGLQTINAIRSFDVIAGLPEVDEKKIAITGASGGGTQSFITSAVEPRLAAAFPAVMVSTGMQGGCTCENACGLRIGTGNIEIASLTAPRPLGMTTAKDWTLNMPEDGFPQLKQLYSLFGKEASVELFPGPQFPHNYNHVARVGMYGFMNRAFGLGQSEPILERDFQLIRRNELTVWDETHPAPDSGLEFEGKLTSQWADAIKQAIWVVPTDSEDVQSEKRRLIREGWKSLTMPAAAMARSLRAQKSDEGFVIECPSGEAKMHRLYEGTGQSSHVNVILKDHSPQKDVRASKGQAIQDSVTTYQCNLMDPLGGDEGSQPLVENPRPAAPYTFGYNASRINRKLSILIAMLNELTKQSSKPLHLIVSADDLYFAAAATMHVPKGKIEKIVVEGDLSRGMNTFRRVDSIVHDDFLPGSLRYQDVEGLVSVIECPLETRPARVSQ